MSGRMEVLGRDELRDLPVEVSAAPGEPWVTAVTSRAKDGGEVRVVWDEVARSVHVLWRLGDLIYLELEREFISLISVRSTHEGVEFRIEMSANGLGGVLAVNVGDHVRIADALLQT